MQRQNGDLIGARKHDTYDTAGYAAAVVHARGQKAVHGTRLTVDNEYRHGQGYRFFVRSMVGITTQASFNSICKHPPLRQGLRELAEVHLTCAELEDIS